MADQLPVFFDESIQPIIDDGKFILETNLGKQIQPADVEMLLLNSFSYMRQIDYIKSNAACRQNLLSFAAGIQIDFLGELVGVFRLPASSARCTVRFTVVSGAPAFIIPPLVRVQSIDQKAIYVTLASTNVDEGAEYVDILCGCTVTGTVGNGYTEGDISNILDPQAFVSTVANTTVPTGGADTESDDELRERIKLAPNRFSVAGPDDAYKFFAKTANPGIVDVAITSPVPGDVNIYPLMVGGELPGSDVLDAVLAVCSAKKVRPLTDSVYAIAPTRIDYAIDISLTLFNDAVESEVLNTVNAALVAYKEAGLNKLGRDVVRTQLVGLCMLQGKVYDVLVNTPADDIIAEPNEYTNCTSITVAVAGYNEG